MTRTLLLFILMLGACAPTAPVRLYLLPEAPERGAAGGGFEGQVIGLSTISMPLYAGDARLTLLGPGLVATQLDDDRWAVSLPEASTSVLAQALARRTGATVLAEPWPADARADMRIDVLAERFVGREDGTVELSGEFRVAHPRLRDSVLAQRFSIQAPTSGEGLEGIAASHALALAGLADQIGEAITAAFAR